jgi:hypothetical protein
LKDFPGPRGRPDLKKAPHKSGRIAFLARYSPQPRKNPTEPEVSFGQEVLWRPGVTRPKKHTFSRKEYFVGLAAEGGKAKKQ